MSAPTRRFVCIKWGTKFGPEYVNRLWRMISRNCSAPAELYCATDDGKGIDPAVKVVPIPDLPVVGHLAVRGWRKLSLCSADLQVPHGPALFLDLDVAISGPLDDFFELPGGFRIIRDYKKTNLRHRYSGNSSVFRYEVGAHADLLELLSSMGERVEREFSNEQQFLSHYFHKRGDFGYWPDGWCVSFKHDCVRPLPFGWFQPPFLPEGARIIVFHGTPKPEDAVIGKGSKWYRKLLPAPWLAEYLR